MRQFFRALFLLAFVAVQILAPVHAALSAPNPEQMRKMGDLKLIENWKIGPVDTENGPSCAMIGRFEESSVLALSDNPQGRPSMAIAFAENTFEVGREYPVTLRGEKGSSVRINGVAANENSIVVDLSAQKNFLSSLAQTSKTLRIDTPVSQSTYDLASVNEAYTQVKTCFKELKGRPSLPQQQQAGAKPEAPQPVVAAAKVEKVEAAPLPRQEETPKPASTTPPSVAQQQQEQPAQEQPSRTVSAMASADEIAAQEAQIIWSKSNAQIEELNKQLSEQKQERAAVVDEKKQVERKLLASIDEDRTAVNKAPQALAQIAPAAGAVAAAAPSFAADGQSEALRNLRISAFQAQRQDAADQALREFDKKQAALKAAEQKLKNQRDTLSQKRPVAADAAVVAQAPKSAPIDLNSSRAWKAGFVAKQAEITQNVAAQETRKQQLTEDLASIHAQYQARIAALEAERGQLQARLGQSENNNRQMAARISDLEQKNSKTVSAPVQQSASAYDQKIAAKYALLSEKLSSMQANINALEQKLKIAEAEKVAAYAQLQETQNKLAAAEQALQAARQKTVAQIAAPSPETLARVSGLEGEISRLQGENSLLSAQLQDMKQRAPELAEEDKAEKERLAAAVEKAEQKAKSAQSEAFEKLSLGQQELDRLRAENAQLKERVATLTASAAVAYNREAVQPVRPAPAVTISNNTLRSELVLQPRQASAQVKNSAQKLSSIQPASGDGMTNNRAAAFLDKVMSYHTKKSANPVAQKPAVQRQIMSVAPVVTAPQAAVVQTPIAPSKPEKPYFAPIAVEKPVVKKPALPPAAVRQQQNEQEAPQVVTNATPAPEIPVPAASSPVVLSAPVTETTAVVAEEKISAVSEDAPAVESTRSAGLSSITLSAALSKAGLAQVSFIASEGGGEKRWQSGDLVGSYVVLTPKAQLRLQAQEFMKRYEGDCPSALEIKLREGVGGSVVADAACAAPDNSYVTSFAFVPRVGKVWVIGHSALPAQAAQVKSLSDNVAFVLENIDEIETAEKPASLHFGSVDKAAEQKKPKFRFESLAVGSEAGRNQIQSGAEKGKSAFETVLIQ
jgi:hypothetical protein